MMKRYELTLQSPVSRSFRCLKAANSLDIDVEKKSIHEFAVEADLEAPYNLGLIVGASGSGKTTLARHIFGDDCFSERLTLATPVLEQFPADFTYEQCAGMLAGVGLTSVPCWIRPAATLSNGQRARAECALQLSHHDEGLTVIDEWTSVVDRTVAKAMSHCLQKHVRKTNRRMVLLSCHYDVIEWLNPDWIIDCNRQEYVDRRSLWRTFNRRDQLEFEIAPVDRASWRYFSRYHYLSDRLPGGAIRTYGLFHGQEQIGFQCFANYVPHRDKRLPMQMHSNRTVIHPDYCGLGLGILVINKTSELMAREGFDVRAKYSSTPVYLAMKKYPEWELLAAQMDTPNGGPAMERGSRGLRKKVLTYSFRWVGAGAA
jgi:ABC-type Mn2+/Zn2+ transport system ATPase subunit